jgi:hypothetical protein
MEAVVSHFFYHLDGLVSGVCHLADPAGGIHNANRGGYYLFTQTPYTDGY